MQVGIGIDVGGTNVKGVLLNELGEILHSHSVSTNDNNGTWLDSVSGLIEHLKTTSKEKTEVLALTRPGPAHEQNTSIALIPKGVAALSRPIRLAEKFITICPIDG